MAVQNSTKKWVFIGGGLIIAAVLVVFFQNYPPRPTDAAGTIGGAERYHAPQIASKDVVVDETERHQVDPERRLRQDREGPGSAEALLERRRPRGVSQRLRSDRVQQRRLPRHDRQ